MKKIFLFLLSVSVFWACQKKEYPTFNYPSAAVSGTQKQAKVAAFPEAAPAIVATPAAAAPQQISASANEDLSVVTEAEAALSAIPAEAITTKVAPAEAAATVEKPVKLTWMQKIVSKKIEKQIKKANSPEVAKAAKVEDTMSLLALIFGGAGLVILLATSAGTLGLLLGIAGLVLGIIGMQRVKKGQAPASSKILALLGLILGGLVTLIGLIAVADYYGN